MTDWHPDIPEEYRNQIVTGDARELAQRIPDESVDLIFTDPVYDRIDDYRWLAETAARVLKERGRLIVFFNIGKVIDVGLALRDHTNPVWILTHTKIGGPDGHGSIGFTRQDMAFFCIKKATPMWQHKLQDAINTPKIRYMHGNHHKWQKDFTTAARWMSQMKLCNPIIYDPFIGSGAFIVASKRLGYNFIASEIDPDTARLARERVQRTQPPLAGLNEAMEQAALFEG